MAVLFLFGSMTYYGMGIALKSANGRGRVLSIGVLFLIVGQAVGNIAMVLGLLPVTGVPMPFFSYGGSALIVNLWAMGLLFSVAVESGRRRKNFAEQEERVPRQHKMRLSERLERQRF